MYHFYHQKIDPKGWKRARETLKAIYADVPETDGCEENIKRDGGCGAWCCQHQTPSLFYGEFLLSWGHVEATWTKEQKADLVIRCLRAYFDKVASKGCVFWNRDNKLCEQHQTRPFNCRIYGQTPDEEFKPRLERLRVLYADDPNVVIRDQCGLVKSRKPPTKAEIDKWFNEIRLVESDLGVHYSLHHDRDGGSYRTYHDHILLKIGSPAFLTHISKLRDDGDASAQEKFIEQFSQDLKRDLKL